jgi:putative flavoprotein involved in K+ transport
MDALENVDVAVVGAGQAGLVVSYLLSEARVEHVVLERGRIGESWRAQRWDTFFLNTPNWSSGLVGMEFRPEGPDGFSTTEDLTGYFEEYARVFDLPILEQTEVRALGSRPSGGYVLSAGSTELHADAVVIASGSMNRPRVPAMAANLPDAIACLSSGTYRNPESLPDGAVVVVGSGQSGCQIAEDLLGAGREVFVCASRVGRIPRSYRGHDIFHWLRRMNFFEARPEDLDDQAMRYAAQPQLSGSYGGHTVSLQSLARDGATLLGRVEGVDGHVLSVGSDLRECVAFGDEVSRMIKLGVDDYIERAGIQAEPPTPDPGEPALPDLKGSDSWRSFDLRANGVSAVVWCTGFDADWSWVNLDVFDDRGEFRHNDGITDSPGLYVCGFPWVSKRKSGLLYGVAEDAERIVRHIESYLGANGGRPR